MNSIEGFDKYDAYTLLHVNKWEKYMKQIGTTENGDALVQMTWKEWGIYSMLDLEKLIKILSAIDDIGIAVTDVIDRFTAKQKVSPRGFHHVVEDGPRIKVSKKRGPYKKKIRVVTMCKTKHAVQIPPPKVEGKRQTLIEMAIDAFNQERGPCTMEKIVGIMKSHGAIFRSDSPTDSLGVSLTASKAAMIVGRDGKEGLWMLPGPEAMAKRSAYLKSIGKS